MGEVTGTSTGYCHLLLSHSNLRTVLLNILNNRTGSHMSFRSESRSRRSLDQVWNETSMSFMPEPDTDRYTTILKCLK